MFEPIKKFRQQMDSGDICLGVSITASDPSITEALGERVDFFWMDLEHTPMSLESLQAHFIAARATSAPALVRVPGSDYKIIKRVLDTGAQGVIVPQFNSAEEAEEVVAASRYAPLGRRGCGPRRAANYGSTPEEEYFAYARDDLLVAVQVESIEAVKNLDSILKVSGIDSIVVGPYDLSMTMGKPGQFTDPEVAGTIESVVTRAREAGFYVGMGMGVDEEFALRAAAMGVQWIQCGVEMGFLTRFVDELFGDIRKRWQAK